LVSHGIGIASLYLGGVATPQVELKLLRDKLRMSEREREVGFSERLTCV
jgi:hypothetical protein